MYTILRFPGETEEGNKMKIIFDSHEQKERFLNSLCELDTIAFCPGRFGLEETGEKCSMPECCRECWENAAEFVVKEN